MCAGGIFPLLIIHRNSSIRGTAYVKEILLKKTLCGQLPSLPFVLYMQIYLFIYWGGGSDNDYKLHLLQMENEFFIYHIITIISVFSVVALTNKEV